MESENMVSMVTRWVIACSTYTCYYMVCNVLSMGRVDMKEKIRELTKAITTTRYKMNKHKKIAKNLEDRIKEYEKELEEMKSKGKD